MPCRAFLCRWLFDDRTSNMRRPDKTGYVIDPMLDGILINNEAVDVIQVWVDPERRDAHRDPALRDYLFQIADIYKLPSLIRWSSTEAMLLVPPQMNEQNEWGEIYGDKMTIRSENEMKKLYQQAVAGEQKDGGGCDISE